MSDHYLFHFNFALMPTIPPSLRHALTERAAGRVPALETVSDLPGLVQSYLCGAGVPGDGVYRFAYSGPHKMEPDGTLIPDESRQQLACYELRMAQTFHDDEYFNGGIYFPHWLFQFAKGDGPLATMQQVNGLDLPKILTKHGEMLIETELAYSPGRFWPIPGQAAPDPAAPVVVEKNTSWNLAEMLEQMADFRDGFSYA